MTYSLAHGGSIKYMTSAKSKNMQYWEQYGEYILMAMPYADEILVGAQGCTLRDADGKELLDLA